MNTSLSNPLSFFLSPLPSFVRPSMTPSICPFWYVPFFLTVSMLISSLYFCVYISIFLCVCVRVFDMPLPFSFSFSLDPLYNWLYNFPCLSTIISDCLFTSYSPLSVKTKTNKKTRKQPIPLTLTCHNEIIELLAATMGTMIKKWYLREKLLNNLDVGRSKERITKTHWLWKHNHVIRMLMHKWRW